MMCAQKNDHVVVKPFVGVCQCEKFEYDKTGLQCRRCFKPRAEDLSGKRRDDN